MRSALVDTNVLIAFVEKGGKALAERLSKYDELVVSPVVLCEYLAGISNTKRGRESQLALERFLESDSVREVELTGKTSIYYAKIFQDQGPFAGRAALCRGRGCQGTGRTRQSASLPSVTDV